MPPTNWTSATCSPRFTCSIQEEQHEPFNRFRPAPPEPTRSELIARLRQARKDLETTHKDNAAQLAALGKKAKAAQAAADKAAAEFQQLAAAVHSSKIGLSATIDHLECQLLRCAPSDLREFISALSKEVDAVRATFFVHTSERLDPITRETKSFTQSNDKEINDRVAALRQVAQRAERLHYVDDYQPALSQLQEVV
jgi:hypothetical protein